MYSAVYWKALATVGCQRILKLPPDIRHRFGHHVRALVVGITYYVVAHTSTHPPANGQRWCRGCKLHVTLRQVSLRTSVAGW